MLLVRKALAENPEELLNPAVAANLDTFVVCANDNEMIFPESDDWEKRSYFSLQFYEVGKCTF